MARREKGGDERKGRERKRKKKGRGGEVKEGKKEKGEGQAPKYFGLEPSLAAPSE